ncbi:glucose-6-phosphate dehydrogenase [Nocardioides daeguensis]|uniref:Glucose-6-phosphate 1-dehydrogenase n=1 Tax=Nocardioides daeguensis TaxID=908359 RepID=A0ABP6V9H9_9ACTN|nr:glucose-6-phosphate dehydrogenase [Nocardioides daeguensis]MBV6726423.1 glucose-6-phosphate dehydrogenase [Nocardioides daeguensis]MCR1772266.1 glucose-6-phosphate dehydrogenase [Nocardioides daeguensis]
MTAPDLVLPPCDFTVFGGTGDLALRKLLPGLYEQERRGQLPAGTRIIGVSRSPLDDAGYRDLVTRALFDHVAEDHLEAGALHRLTARLHHLSLDIGSADDWHRLHGLLKDRPDRPAGEEATRIHYLAVASELFGPICDRLDALGLVTPECRVVLEKPIGADLASSHQVNDAVGRVFAERQIFRIDHYLGKESVQNLLVTRFANVFLEPIWNSRWVDHVQITVSETLGVAGRGEYYDKAGALRDMVQNHLLQMLCLIAMEPPTYVGGDPVRDEKLKVLQALKPLTGADVDRFTVRGQYTSYGEKVGHPSTTETFVALRAEVQNWRWAGVPFYLRTGKRLARKESTIEVVFKEPPHAMFPHSEGVTTPNRLTVRMQPDEGMQLHMTAKHPGPGGIRLHPASLDLSYADAFDERSPEPYERLLMDVMRGIPTLFMRRDEVEAAWTWTQPVLEQWERAAVEPVRYHPGSEGPAAAARLLARDGRRWQEAGR